MASRQPHFGGGFGDDRGDEFVVQDLHDGLNEWRNIQDIVRLSFVAFHKALQAQIRTTLTCGRLSEGR